MFLCASDAHVDISCSFIKCAINVKATLAFRLACERKLSTCIHTVAFGISNALMVFTGLFNEPRVCSTRLKNL